MIPQSHEARSIWGPTKSTVGLECRAPVGGRRSIYMRSMYRNLAWRAPGSKLKLRWFDGKNWNELMFFSRIKVLHEEHFVFFLVVLFPSFPKYPQQGSSSCNFFGITLVYWWFQTYPWAQSSRGSSSSGVSFSLQALFLEWNSFLANSKPAPHFQSSYLVPPQKLEHFFLTVKVLAGPHTAALLFKNSVRSLTPSLLSLDFLGVSGSDSHSRNMCQAAKPPKDALGAPSHLIWC